MRINSNFFIFSILFFTLFLSSPLLSKDPELKLLLNEDYESYLFKKLKDTKKDLVISSFMWCCDPDKYSSIPCKILTQVINLVKKGVNVTIILEKDSDDDSKSCNVVTEKIFQSTLLKKYSNLKIYFDSLEQRSHQKIILIDNDILFLGSHNITQSALKYNNEASVFIKSEKMSSDIKKYLEEIIKTSKRVY